MDNTNKKYRILYVEDDQGLADLYVARLCIEGYEVQHCFDGDKALTLGRSFKPDLILLDLMMPTLDGFSALEMFRGMVETSASKIIIMSALNQPYDIAKAKALGADDYVVKSQVLIDDVMSKIRQHLGQLQSQPAASLESTQPAASTTQPTVPLAQDPPSTEPTNNSQ